MGTINLPEEPLNTCTMTTDCLLSLLIKENFGEIEGHYLFTPPKPFCVGKHTQTIPDATLFHTSAHSLETYNMCSAF